MFEEQLEQSINEAYAGFGQSAHMDVKELRRLYYGRKEIYVTFTDNGDINITDEQSPESLLCYELNDVIGKKVKSNDFYAYVFRADKSRGKFIDNINEYSRDDFLRDVEYLRLYGYEYQLDEIVNFYGFNSYIRKDFERLWNVTYQIALRRLPDDANYMWSNVLFDLGYTGFHDPSNSDLFGDKQPTTLLLNYKEREDLDILPIQEYREDPRSRITKYVNREKMKMRGAKNRVAKRRDTSKRVL